jgi:hypothetical protein
LRDFALLLTPPPRFTVRDFDWEFDRGRDADCDFDFDRDADRVLEMLISPVFAFDELSNPR